MISRLGVLGGMFDPVHNGHVEAARFACKLLEFDLVKMIPCHIPNHRNSAVSDKDHRLNMLRLAIDSDARLEADDVELKKNEVSYSIETLRTLREQKIAHSIVLILGMDSFNTLTKWFEWKELFSLCSFCVLARAGLQIDGNVYEEVGVHKRLAQNAADFYQDKVGKIIIAENFKHDISSTEIRSKLNAKKNMQNNLDSKVYSYIHKHELYKNNLRNNFGK